MSDATRFLRGVCSLAFTAASLSAQARDVRSVEVRFAEAQRRVDSLSKVWNHLKAVADSAAPAPKLDVGLLHVRYDSTVSMKSLAAIRDAWRIAAPEIAKVQGDAAAQTIGAAELVASESVQDWDRQRHFQLRLRNASSYQNFYASSPDPRRLADEIERIAADLASLRIATGSERQLFSSVPRVGSTRDAWTDLAIWHAVSPSTVARRCIAGVLADCARVVLSRTDTMKVEDWYETSDYAAIVERHIWTSEGAVRIEIARRCVEAHDEGACSDAAHHINPPYPVPIGTARHMFFALALEMGGPKAFERLLSAPADDRARLEAAAGVPMDTILAEWQRRIAAARPTHGVAGAFAGTLWFSALLFALLRRRPTCV